MPFRFCSIPLICLLLTHIARSQDTVPLWSGTPPNSIQNDTLRERTLFDNSLRVSQVNVPTLTVYLPSPARATGTAIMICPGGAYGFLAFDVEGTRVAKWLASQGIAAFVLKYRLPDPRLMTRQFEVPLTDALQAIKLIRSQATHWKLQPGRIGIIGFSAGGHLAATVSTQYLRMPGSDPVVSQPNFAILVYPVITTGPSTHQGSINNLLGRYRSDSLELNYSAEKQVTAATPPTLLLHPSGDETVPVENSLLYYIALKKAGIPVEMHLYRDGGHGFGMSPPDPPTASYGHWKEHLLAWLKSQNL